MRLHESLLVLPLFITQDEKVGKWLKELMQGGMETVDRFLNDQETPGKRYLAEKYMLALNTYEQQQSSTL